MISPTTTEMMMDETDYNEHLLLTALDTKPSDSNDTAEQPTANNTLLIGSVESVDEEDPGAEKPSVVTPNREKSKKRGSSATLTPKKEKEESESQKETEKVDIPSQSDILCGQSRIYANHAGNRRFQVLLDLYAPKYDSATSKQEKMTLTKEIVACVGNEGGRFLKFKDGFWTEIPTVTARDKVSHALRTKVASWKRQQQEKIDGATGKPTRPTHRRRSSARRRRSSSSTITTSASEIATNSFDSNNSDPNIMEELLRTQREIFAQLCEQCLNTGGGGSNSRSSGSRHPLKN